MKPTAVTEHIMTYDYPFLFDDVKILANGKWDIELLNKESLTCKKLKPSLNNNVGSFPLELF